MSNHRAIRPKTVELGDFKPAAEPRRPDVDASVPADSASPEADISAAGPFQLSRIYSEGWHAGMSHQTDGSVTPIDARAESLNPCQGTVERARWAEGFGDAVRRKLAHPERQHPPFRTDFIR